MPGAETQPQVFTLEAVNAIVPRLSTIVGRQLARRTDIESRLRTLASHVGELPDELTPPEPDDPEPVKQLKRELLVRIAEYQEGWHEVEAMGAVIKDPSIGLVDFYGRVEGTLVWLCWKFGEPEVGYYHGLTEGIRGRKALLPQIKQRLLN